MFGKFQVGRGVHGCDEVAASLAPDAKGELLGHDAAGYVYGRFFAKESGRLRFKAGDVVAAAIAIGEFCCVKGISFLRERSNRMGCGRFLYLHIS